MPYQSIELDAENIVYTRLIGVFSKNDIAEYIQFLLSSKTYHDYGRLLVDYAEFEEIDANFDDLLAITQPMSNLTISDGVIWQAGINADPTNIGVSRQANTLLQIHNTAIKDLKLKFFDGRQEATDWLLSKPY